VSRCVRIVFFLKPLKTIQQKNMNENHCFFLFFQFLASIGPVFGCWQLPPLLLAPIGPVFAIS
jgi:hypothetical protein